MAYRWAPWGAIVSFVALVQLGSAAQAAEPTLALASQSAWGAGIQGEFQTLVGDRVFFSEGSAELGARARKALMAQAAWLALHPGIRVTIEGHADDHGGDDNALSGHRAEAVRQRLIEAGIAPERIRTVAYGRRHLIAACADPLCGPQNRRAETVVGWPTVAIESREARRPPHDDVSRPSPRRLN
jgi:outer membrane protein OmpA-like peptidoglycan-associated protein